MDTKTLVTQYLNIEKLGKKTLVTGFSKNEDGTPKEIQRNIGDVVVLCVQRFDGKRDFVVARWHEPSKSYGIIYDPNAKGGVITKILHGYA